jgi:hypothetical protein
VPGDARHSDPPFGDRAYATPAAMVFSLALALIATVSVQRGATVLRLSRVDLQRRQMEYALDGAQLSAAATVIRSGAGGPYHWSLASDVGWLDALAERESDKVDLGHAAQLDDQIFQALGVSDIAELKVRLAAAAARPSADIASLDSAKLWRACAPSLISPFGGKAQLQPHDMQQPHMGDLTPAWRVAELWRMQVTTGTGWRDERIVRFTGDAVHPAAVVSRRLSRGNGGQGQCEAILAAAA